MCAYTEYGNIGYDKLEELANFHREDKTILDSTKDLCVEICGRELDATEFNPEYPRIDEEILTQEDISEALKQVCGEKSAYILKNCQGTLKKYEIIRNRYLLSREEAILVRSYTYEDEKAEVSAYEPINKKLREGDIEDQLTNKKSYLRLLLRALRKLPRIKPQTLYRGIRGDNKEYKVGEEIMWKGFSSTTKNMKITQNFLTNLNTGKVEGTLFEIRNAWGYELRDFSAYAEEGIKNIHKTIFAHFVLFSPRDSLGAYDEVQGQRSHTAR